MTHRIPNANIELLSNLILFQLHNFCVDYPDIHAQVILNNSVHFLSIYFITLFNSTALFSHDAECFSDAFH